MKTINILILTVSLFFFCQLQSYGQKGVKALPLKYKGIKLNHDFKNVLPRIVREYNNHYFVATERAIYEFSKEGKLLSTFKIPKQIEYVAGFYKSSKDDLIFVATYTRLYVLTKQGTVKKVFRIGEHYDYLDGYGLFNYYVHYDNPNKDTYFVRYINESLKERVIKLSHNYVNGELNISNSRIYGISDDLEIDEIISYKLPLFNERVSYNLTRQFPKFNFDFFIGMHNNKALFFSIAEWKNDTLKVIDFSNKSINSYLFKFKQPKLSLQTVDTEEVGYTHPRGHFIDFRNEKLLVLTNTVEGSFIYEVEF
jgi:hypothetical protein